MKKSNPLNKVRTGEIMFPILSGFFFGLNIALIAGDNIFGEGKDIMLNSSIMLLSGTICGCIPLVFIHKFQTRKEILRIGIIISILASLIGGFVYFSESPSNPLIISGLRFFMGITAGLSCVAPVYLVEEHPEKYDRGSYFSSYQFAITLGIFTSYIIMIFFYEKQDNPEGFVNIGNEYYSTVFFLFTIVSFIYLYTLDSLTPNAYNRWNTLHKDFNLYRDELKDLLLKISQKQKLEEPIHPDLIKAIKNTLDILEEPKKIVKKPWLKVYIIPVLFSIGIISIQQFTGINIIIFELPQLLNIFSVSNSGVLFTLLIIGFVNVIATIPGMIMIRKFKRKTILQIGLGGIIVSLLLLTVQTHRIDPNYDIIPEKYYYYHEKGMNNESNIICAVYDSSSQSKERFHDRTDFKNKYSNSTTVLHLYIPKDSLKIDSASAMYKRSTKIDNGNDFDIKIELKNGYINKINGCKYFFKYKSIKGNYNTDLLYFITFVTIFIIFFASTLGILGWLIPAELLPISNRTQGMTLVAATHWIINLFIVLTFDIAFTSLFFIIFLMITVSAFLFSFKFFPETKDKSLKSIDYFWRSGKGMKEFNDENSFKENSDKVKIEINGYMSGVIERLVDYIDFITKEEKEEEKKHIYGKTLTEWRDLKNSALKYYYDRLLEKRLLEKSKIQELINVSELLEKDYEIIRGEDAYLFIKKIFESYGQKKGTNTESDGFTYIYEFKSETTKPRTSENEFAFLREHFSCQQPKPILVFFEQDENNKDLIFKMNNVEDFVCILKECYRYRLKYFISDEKPNCLIYVNWDEIENIKQIKSPT